MNRDTSTTHIAVVGGGILGSTIALALLDAGHKVTVFDPDVAGTAASWGNAGHIAVEQVAPLASLATLAQAPARLWGRQRALFMPLSAMPVWLPFARRLVRASLPAHFAHGQAALEALMAGAMEAWQGLAHRLAAPALLRRDGHFIVWDTPQGAARGRQAWRDTPTASFHDVDKGDLGQLANLLGRLPAGAIRCEGSGHITSHTALREGLRRAIAQAGGVWRPAAARLERDAEGRCQVAGEGPFDLVVLAAGVASRPLVEGLGHSAPMVPERGYHLHASGRQWPADLPPVVFEERSMIVTRFENGLRASSFVELAPVDRPADPAKWALLRQRLEGLPFDRDHTEWMGARPTLPDYLPAIGRSRRVANLVYAFGHQHLGLTLAPVTAGLVADLVAGRASKVDLSPFDLARFERGVEA